jgi:hypothetical protein
MGRPIGSPNRRKPVNEAFRIALRQRPTACAGSQTGCSTRARRATFNPFAKLRTGWTGNPRKPSSGDVPIERLNQLYAIAAGGLTDTDRLALPPPCKIPDS